MKTQTLALLLAAWPALAATQALAVQPYEPVVATYDTAGADDTDLKAFIDTLQKAIDSGDGAAGRLSRGDDAGSALESRQACRRAAARRGGDPDGFGRCRLHAR
jgi:hypothetical protein